MEIFSSLASPSFPGTIPTDAILPSSANATLFLSKILPLLALIVDTLTLSLSPNCGNIMLDDHFNFNSLFSFTTFAVLLNSTSPADVTIFS